MNILSNLTKIVSKSPKRVGRGIGSGVGGHTTGRGAKGDKVRGKTKLTFDGTKIKKSWLKRLPFLRGKHRMPKLYDKFVFRFNQLEKWFDDGALVNFKSLSQKSNLPLSQLQKKGVKIISTGKKATKSFKFEEVTLSSSIGKVNE